MQEFVFDFLKMSLGSYFPFIFILVGVVIFTILNQKNTYVRKDIILSIALICAFSALSNVGDQCLGDYFESLRQQASASGFNTVIDYIKAMGLDVSKYHFYNVLHFVFSSSCYCFRVIYSLHAYLLIASKDIHKNNIIITIPCIICCLLYLTSYFTHLVIYFDEVNFYFNSSSLYFIGYAVSIFYILLIFASIGKKYKYDAKAVVILLYDIVITIMTMLFNSYNIFKFNIAVIDTMLLAAICLYYLMLENNAKYLEHKKQEKELEESRVSATTNQIRPHFIFNCISNIVELCEEDSPAQKALITFSRYLRTNINALNSSQPVLFENELSYIKNYVSLESIRYPDQFEMIYDIQISSFFVPQVSIEIYVENAIKHNVGYKDGIVHVTLKTWEDNDKYIIEVIDDGVGFEVSALNNNNNVGTTNARYRLEKMVEAKVVIDSKIKQGTCVHVEIPKNTGDK